MGQIEGRPDWRGIIYGGERAILDDFAQRAEILSKLHAAFYAAVEELAGAEARRGVERDGLRNLHRHLPANKVGLIEHLIKQQLADDLYYWSYRVGRETLRLPEPFYVDMLIVIRVHYPHLVARAGGESIAPPTDWRERARLGVAALRDPRLIVNQIARRVRKRGKIAAHRIAYDPKAYHGDLPTLARSHGPHIDTWYGHSFDGFNVWLSIDGVNPDNTVILYPDMFGRKIDYDPRSMYLARGIALPRPLKVDLKPGQLLLFNPEILHGTQVNISDETRVALTMRINPGEPRFNDDAPFNAEHWYSSRDLAERRFTRISLFPAGKYLGAPSIEERAVPPDPALTRIALAADADAGPDAGEDAGEDLALCEGSALVDGGKLAVDVGARKLLLVRTAQGIRAFERRCPHQGVDLADGAREGDRIFCPGHGIAFDLVDGASKCSAFRLRQVPVAEHGGRVVLRRGAPARRSEALAG